MLKGYRFFEGRHAYVHSYYERGKGFVTVDGDWSQREDRGEPPVIVLAYEDERGRLTVTRDVSCGPVYDALPYLMGDNEGDGGPATFAELAALARACGLPVRRRMLIYQGDLRPALIGTPEDNILRWGPGTLRDRIKRKIEGVTKEEVWEMGPKCLAIDADVQALGLL